MIQILKKLLFRVFLLWSLIVVVGVLMNRWFVLLYWSAVRSFDWRWWVDWLLAFLVFVLLLIVFPIVYIWSIKAWLLLTALWSVWWSYRNTVASEIADIVAPQVVSNAQQWTNIAQHVTQSITTRKKQLPLPVRFALNQLLKKIPLAETIIETITSLDTTAFTDEETFKQSMHDTMQPYLEKTSLQWSGGRWLLAKILVGNVVILGVLWWLIVL